MAETSKRKYKKLKKYYLKLRKLFPSSINNTKVDYTKLKLSDSSYYSTSNVVQARITSDIIKSFIGDNNITVTECCANVGGNTLSFAENFSKVNSYEIEGDEYSNLVHNLAEYKISNVEVINRDYTKDMYELKQDVVFLDPPWTGPGYKKYDKLKLKLSGINIVDIVKKLLDMGTKLVLIKAPFNYDIEELKNKLSDYNIYTYDIMHKDKLIYRIYAISKLKGLSDRLFDETTYIF